MPTPEQSSRTAKQSWPDAEPGAGRRRSRARGCQGRAGDGEAEFADAQADAAELKESGWIISGRNEVGDVRGVETIVKAIFGLSNAMSMVFLIVSVLVCFAAITRSYASSACS